MYSSKHRLHKQFDHICRFFRIFASIVLKYSTLEFGKNGSAFVRMMLNFLGTHYIYADASCKYIYTHDMHVYTHM